MRKPWTGPVISLVGLPVKVRPPISFFLQAKLFLAPVIQEGYDALRVLLKTADVHDISRAIEASLMILISKVLDKTDAQLDETSFGAILRFFYSNRSDSDETRIEELVEDEDERDEAEELLNARKQLINGLGRLAARPDFNQIFSATSQSVHLCIGWLSALSPEVCICALVLFGNAAYGSDQTAADLIQTTEVGERLVQLIKTSSNGVVLKSAFEALQMLSRPLKNRLKLGALGLLEAMSPSWRQQIDVQLSCSALSLIRHLLQETLLNIARFLVTEAQNDQTLFQSLVIVFRESTDPDIRLQCGLTALEIWHSIYTRQESLAPKSAAKDSIPTNTANESQHEEAKEEVEEIYEILAQGSIEVPDLTIMHHLLTLSHEHLTDAIELLLPVIDSHNRSFAIRAWLSMALISRRDENADPLYDSFIKGRGSSAFQSVLLDDSVEKSKERSNARVLLSKLMAYFVSTALRKSSKIMTHEIKQAKNDRRSEVLNSIWQASFQMLSPN